MIVELPFTKILSERLTEKTPLMQFVIGPRQVGKTTGVQLVIDRHHGPVHYKLAESELDPTPLWLRLQWQKALGLGDDPLLVIDEIQKVNRWAEALKSLWDETVKNKKRIKCVFLGSSSMDLIRGVHESLTGRHEIIRVFHWDFLLSQKLESNLTLDDYLLYGGYPGSYKFLPDPERFKFYVRDAIIRAVLEKDILLYHTIKKPALFRQCVELLANYPAQELSYTKLLGQLQETGNIEIVKYYLQILEHAHLFFSLQKYSSKVVKTKASSPKILPRCPAIVHALSETEIPRGRLLELVVGNKLAEFADGLYYWREGHFEVDFVMRLDQKLYAIEVKSGRNRHSQSLNSFVSKFKKVQPVIIDDSEYIRLSRLGKKYF